jgi:hypothetical protein
LFLKDGVEHRLLHVGFNIAACVVEERIRAAAAQYNMQEKFNKLPRPARSKPSQCLQPDRR